MDHTARFKVVIVGGGISGLTLANALEQAPHEIDWILLEAGSEIAPQVGAGFALLPNGCRILDQLGVYADLASQYVEVASSGVYDSQGRSLFPRRLDVARLVGARMSYPLGWVERRAIIQALYNRLRHKDRVVTNQKACSVEVLNDDGVRVHCIDGTSYSGHHVVGADGVKSTIRHEMWRLSQKGLFAEDINVADELKSLTAEYQCLFGISNPQADLTAGTTEDTIAQDVSVTVSVSPGGRVFWFLFGRMPQTYQYKEIPRFSNNNATDFATRHGDLRVCPDAGITISDLVASREMMVLVPLEEGVFKTWTANRITCLGDSVSKMTPHTGTGGMLAMEAAAALANTLVSLSEQNSIPNLADLAPALQLWETRLKSRAAVAVELSGNAARIQALKSWPHRAFVKYILRHVGDARADEICDTAVGAERIQYLPLPLRSLEGNMPFNPEHGIARHESKLRRFFVAICAMLLGLATYCVLGQIGERVPNYSLGPYDTFRSLVQSYQELKMLFKCPLLADYGVWYMAMIIESSRRSHNLNAVRCSPLWSFLSFWKPSFFIPLYCSIHYALSPIETFGASDQRLTTLVYAKTLLPTAITVFGAYVWSASPFPGSVWDSLIFTLGFYILHRLTARCMPHGTPQADRLLSVHKDLPYLCLTIMTAVIASVYVHIYTLGALNQTMAPSGSGPRTSDHHMIEMDEEHGILSVTVICWSFLLIWDLKVSGMIIRSWLVILLQALVCTLLGGTGALLGGTWLCREFVLCSAQHKTAVIRSKLKD